jgi:hypothetical protein
MDITKGVWFRCLEGACPDTKKLLDMLDMRTIIVVWILIPRQRE